MASSVSDSDDGIITDSESDSESDGGIDSDDFIDILESDSD